MSVSQHEQLWKRRKSKYLQLDGGGDLDASVGMSMESQRPKGLTGQYVYKSKDFQNKNPIITEVGKSTNSALNPSQDLDENLYRVSTSDYAEHLPDFDVNQTRPIGTDQTPRDILMTDKSERIQQEYSVRLLDDTTEQKDATLPIPEEIAYQQPMS